MPVPDIAYSPHDLCMTLFLPLNCDGTVADEVDAFTLNGALVGGESTIVVNEVIDTDITPPAGELTLDAGGPNEQVLGYASYTGSTFTLITGTTVAGAVDDTDAVTVARSEPIVHCGFTQVRLVPIVIDEVTDEDPGGVANQPSASRTIAAQADGYNFEGDLTSRENPRLWALTNQFAPIYDEETENLITGWEPRVTTASTCPTCGLVEASCKTMAMIAVYNAWCGKTRHPTYPFVGKVIRSLAFAPNIENIGRGRGFAGAGRVLRATTEANSAFVDPWGIDPRTGVQTPWSERLISNTKIAANADLSALLTNGCGCGACPNPTIGWPGV